MRKQLLIKLCGALLSLLLLLPLGVFAAEINPEAACSLTLHYTQEQVGFPGLEIRIYRVAEAMEDWTFEKLEPYSGWPVNIHGITSQAEWQTVADTLTAYIAAEGTAPYRTGITDEKGTVAFAELETGLYLVAGATAENEQGIWSFNRFMVYLPTPQGSEYLYDVEALPKCTGFTPAPEGTEYKVLKLWQDEGYEHLRPQSVTVDILLDGQVWETAILSPENDWSYTWKAPQGGGQWTVVERDIPEDYWVTVSEKDQTFVITNSYMEYNPDDPGGGNDPEPPIIPPTGDTFPLWLWITVMCISGFLLTLLGIARGRRDEKRK